MWLRLVATAGALGLMIPGLMTDAVGVVVLAGVYFLQKKKADAEKAS
jgi:UPF0716 family protein affecting phage T7 exclusion